MLDYQQFENKGEGFPTETVLELYAKIFGSEYLGGVRGRLLDARDLHLALALFEGRPVGYKLGYRLDAEKYYSWIGGVLPEFRGKGIASKLMALQHDFARRKGYRTVQTKTMNRWRNMLILNIKQGFDIVGTVIGADGNLRIVLEKRL